MSQCGWTIDKKYAGNFGWRIWLVFILSGKFAPPLEVSIAGTWLLLIIVTLRPSAFPFPARMVVAYISGEPRLPVPYFQTIDACIVSWAVEFTSSSTRELICLTLTCCVCVCCHLKLLLLASDSRPVHPLGFRTDYTHLLVERHVFRGCRLQLVTGIATCKQKPTRNHTHKHPPTHTHKQKKQSKERFGYTHKPRLNERKGRRDTEWQ